MGTMASHITSLTIVYSIIFGYGHIETYTLVILMQVNASGINAYS